MKKTGSNNPANDQTVYTCTLCKPPQKYKGWARASQHSRKVHGVNEEWQPK